MASWSNSEQARNCERYIGNPAIKKWNQSFYFNFYDPVARIGCFIRVGIMENMGETNSFFVFFKEGMPLFQRINMNLPYTDQRMDPGLTVAGLTIKTIQSLMKAQIVIDEPDFGADLVWDGIHEMEDSIALTKDGDDTIAKELAFVHLEGHCKVSGTIRVRGGETIHVDAKGFRDISVGPRNWDAVQHYRLAWPIFDNGMACVVVHALVTGGDAYQKILFDGQQWLSVPRLEETITYEADKMGFAAVHWKVWDERDRLWEFIGKPLFRWAFPFDSFVMVEQMMEYRLTDGTIGYGMGEGGFRFPWSGNGN